MTMNSVFSGRILSLFTLIHSEMFSFSLEVLYSSPSSFDDSEISVSSAYRLTFENCRQFSKSIRYSMKTNGPRQDPYGIPHAIGRELDL